MLWGCCVGMLCGEVCNACVCVCVRGKRGVRMEVHGVGRG